LSPDVLSPDVLSGHPLYFYGASKKTTQAQGHFWKYVISDKL
jgi:hypothetical protein